MRLRQSRFGLFYGCDSYPKCKATHGAHKLTGKPLGIPGNKATKEARIRAHAAFDVLWKSKRMTRSAAYEWLARVLVLPTGVSAHIGNLDVAECSLVIEAVQSLAKPVPD
jgi:ssDNA-binding Zn-finger/Zn-ribbon topoisomerase 1